MDNLNIFISDSLDRYYSILKKTGYLKDSDVFKLLTAIHIDDLFKDYSEFIAEEDNKMLSNILNCIKSSSCLFNSSIRFNKILCSLIK